MKLKQRDKWIGSSFLLILVLILSMSINPVHIEAATTKTLTVTVKHPKQNTVKLSWNAVSGAKGYYVYVATEIDGAYRLVADTSKRSILLENVVDNQTNYCKVVSYTVKSGIKTEQVSSGVMEVASPKIGIDVSKWQGDVDWVKVKQAGINYVMIRAGYSYLSEEEVFTQEEDEKLKVNLSGAIQAGIPVGVYYKSIASTVAEAKQDAQYALSLISGYSVTYPVAIDIEPNDGVHNVLSKEENSAIVAAFCDTIQAAGYEAMFYTNYFNLIDHFNYSTVSKYQLWLARYNVDFLGYENPVRMWQITSQKVLDGITVNTVDLNFEYDYQEAISGIVEADLKQATMAAPSIKAASSACKNIKVQWNKVLGAEQYYIYASTKKTGGYKKIGETEGNTFLYKNLTPGNTYYIKVAACQKNGEKLIRVRPNAVSCKVIVPQVKQLKASSNSYNSNKVTWKAVSGATGYYVYYKPSTTKNFSNKNRVKVTTNKFFHKGLKTGTSYDYKVVAYCKGKKKTVTSVKSSAIVSATPKLSKPSLQSAKAGKKKVTITWNKVSGASGYEVYRSTKKSGGYKLVKTIKKGNTVAFTNTKLKKRTTYYYKVRAFRTQNSKRIYSKFSVVKSAKTK